MEYIKYEENQQVGILTVNNPKALNSLNRDVLDELSTLISNIKTDNAIRALIITGEGKAFVAGADIETQSKFTPEGGREWGRMGSAIFRDIELLEIPVIAAVNGFALGGGCELALACDFIIAGEKAKFGQPEVGLGITPGFSGTQRLPKRVGIGRAKELIFTGDMIDAKEAERIGLANRVVAQDSLMDECFALALRILKNGPVAVKYSKAAINRGANADIDTGISIENELFAMCYATKDQKEGMAAFLEKRKAAFTGE